MGNSMSLVLNSSGGGSVTINEPTTASNFTQTLPASDGTVMVSGNMPTFSAYQTVAQTLSAATWTKLNFGATVFDTNSCFSTSTSRFTPTVAGYYIFFGGVNAGNNSQDICNIYKNGSAAISGVNFSNGYLGNVSGILYANGTTDYFEAYGYFGGGGTTATGTIATTFSAIMIRGA